jgi:hypothetical protein
MGNRGERYFCGEPQQPHVAFHSCTRASHEAQPDELADVGWATYESHADMN